MKRKVRKIMLISPPVTRPKDFSADVVRVSVFFPLGLAYLASILQQSGKFEIKALDALIEKDIHTPELIYGGEWFRYGLNDQELSEAINGFAPDVVCVSCLFAAMYWDMINICRLVKEINPDIVTIAGGAHVGGNAREVIRQAPEVDFVVIGEGEVALLEIIESLQAGGGFHSIDGIGYRKLGEPRVNSKSRYIEKLDDIPFPDRKMFDMERYFSKALAHSGFRQVPFAPMISSRGCPFRCSFCALGNHWGKRQRSRSPENVLDEIEYLIKEFGIREIHFEDDNLTANKQRALSIFDGMIERGFSISWNVPSGMAVYTLDREILEKMQESGCYSVSLAIESGNQKVLSRLMNKPVDLEKVPGLIRNIREIGMEVRGFFILGYPDETKETIQETINFAREIELDWAYFFIASPLPNTQMWKTCIEKGYMSIKDFDPIRSFHKSIIRTSEFDPEYLAEIREKAIIDVNFINNVNLHKYDIEKAIIYFSDVVSKYPNFDFANFYLAEAYLKKGDVETAKASYLSAIKANPDHVEARMRLSQLGFAIDEGADLINSAQIV